MNYGNGYTNKYRHVHYSSDSTLVSLQYYLNYPLNTVALYCCSKIQQTVTTLWRHSYRISILFSGSKSIFSRVGGTKEMSTCQV